MSTVIVIIILVIIIGFALKGTIKHLSGKGSCCGGDNEIKAKVKVLENPAISKKIIKINGMSCEHCSNSVMRAVNDIPGASCKVDLKRGQAEVSLDREVDDDVIVNVIERLNYEVVSIG